MNRLSERTHRRRQSAHASAVLGWLLVLLAMVSCCSVTAPGSASHQSGTRTAAADRAMTPVHAVAVRTVVADAPEDRGLGSSCHGTSEHATPVVLPGQSAPVALPGVTATAPVAPLTGAAAIRGPSNDAVREVDHLRLQVQRI
ncbi:hypothetical protein [Streptomyces atratus]|uniref:hypothetical protein n=1 Tax=Streptomyces atratus TaxID=1893 RepID=UPI0022538D4B|nr:hypothetical protein [Streptomyces atratus]MCX5339445.1 hypothetical protein [Streptomyces atratus]